MSSLSSIAPGRSSSLQPESIQSYCMYVFLGRITLTSTCEGVHRRTSLTTLFLLLQQFPACLDSSLTCMVLEIGSRYPYNCCFMGCCFQDLFNTASNNIGASTSDSLMSFQDAHGGVGVLRFCRDAVGEFYSPCQLG